MAERRLVKTLDDMAELFSDYQVVTELRSGGTITLSFPFTGKYAVKPPDVWAPINYADEGQRFGSEVRSVIRSLVCNPQFHRMTNTVDQIDGFFKKYDRKNMVLYKVVKLRKRGGEPFTIIFEDYKAAMYFYRKLRQAVNELEKRLKREGRLISG
jgi:hypothetical protein